MLGHGGGGRMTQQLLDKIFLPAFDNAALNARHDGAIFDAPGKRLAFTTDSYVVRPLIFPGGNIGDLAVNGTVNDLAMCGARPIYLSAGFILEEGLPIATLETAVSAMRDAAARAGVAIVTGDTKVVDKGHGDGIFISTAGVGAIESTTEISPAAVRSGDAIIVSGDLGAHGIAVLSVREGLEFESAILSDTASIWPAVEALLRAGIEIHCLRDLTRGGLSSALNEIASSAGIGMSIDETRIPVRENVRGACEILGLDPLYVANEGRFVAIVPAQQQTSALQALQSVAVSQGAAYIGTVSDSVKAVILRSRIGGNRVLDMLSGEQLPRIC